MKKTERSFITDFIEEQCESDAEFRREYEAAIFATKLMKARRDQKIPQETVAEQLKTKQPAIARLERSPASVSFGRMIEYANALGYDFKLVKRSGKAKGK